jgi:hypothetical protein
VQRIAGGPLVVIAPRIDRRAVLVDLAVEDGQVKVRNMDGRKVLPSGAV